MPPNDLPRSRRIDLSATLRVPKEFMGWLFVQLALNTELPWKLEWGEPE